MIRTLARHKRRQPPYPHNVRQLCFHPHNAQNLLRPDGKIYHPIITNSTTTSSYYTTKTQATYFTYPSITDRANPFADAWKLCYIRIKNKVQRPIFARILDKRILRTSSNHPFGKTHTTSLSDKYRPRAHRRNADERGRTNLQKPLPLRARQV